MPKSDRGLLTLKKDIYPSPMTYKNCNELAASYIMKRNAAFSIPLQHRRVNFYKFSMENRKLVEKGLI